MGGPNIRIRHGRCPRGTIVLREVCKMRHENWLDAVEELSKTHGESAAITDVAGTITYSELHSLVEARAADLHELGLAPHTVIAVIARNSARFLVEVLAIQRAGGLAALLNWRLAERELRILLDLVKPWAVSTDVQCAELADAAADPSLHRLRIDEVLSGDGEVPPLIADRLRDTDPFVLMHSSGTTGVPKIIPMKNGSMLFEAERLGDAVPEIAAGAPAIRVGPLFHLAGLAQATIIIRHGGHLHLPPTFDADTVLDLIPQAGIALVDAAPAALRALVDAARVRATPPDTSTLRELSYGGAPIEPSLVRDLHDTFNCRLRQFYGSTEAAVVVSMLKPEDHLPQQGGAADHISSAGQITSTWQWRIVDTEGAQVTALDTAGELEVKGPWLTEGYWNNPELNAAAFTNDGFYRMGDIVTIDADGFLTVADRAKDMIISGGENIYPREVELVLDEHPAIHEAAAVGVPSEKWGETVHAVVVTVRATAATEITEEALIEWCRERLAHYKCPTTIAFVDELPRTATGKILRRALR
jgi:acyl-CoA synthetase (AMP-forming)/AMP-acid ligase II